MKERNLEYEAKFRSYLFSFDLENHKDICKNINVRHNQWERLVWLQMNIRNTN